MHDKYSSVQPCRPCDLIIGETYFIYYIGFITLTGLGALCSSPVTPQNVTYCMQQCGHIFWFLIV